MNTGQTNETAAERPAEQLTDIKRRRTVIVLAAGAVLCAAITAFLLWDYHKTDLETVEFGDRFLTLSTCACHVEDGRFVVVAKEILF